MGLEHRLEHFRRDPVQFKHEVGQIVDRLTANTIANLHNLDNVVAFAEDIEALRETYRRIARREYRPTFKRKNNTELRLDRINYLREALLQDRYKLGLWFKAAELASLAQYDAPDLGFTAGRVGRILTEISFVKNDRKHRIWDLIESISDKDIEGAGHYFIQQQGFVTAANFGYLAEIVEPRLESIAESMGMTRQIESEGVFYIPASPGIGNRVATKAR